MGAYTVFTFSGEGGRDRVCLSITFWSLLGVSHKQVAYLPLFFFITEKIRLSISCELSA